MTLSVAKFRPLRKFGLYRSSGKHAAPRATVPRAAILPPRWTGHASPAQRLTGPDSDRTKAA